MSANKVFQNELGELFHEDCASEDDKQSEVVVANLDEGEACQECGGPFASDSDEDEEDDDE